jgi:hypothetical protein
MRRKYIKAFDSIGVNIGDVIRDEARIYDDGCLWAPHLVVQLCRDLYFKALALPRIDESIVKTRNPLAHRPEMPTNMPAMRGLMSAATYANKYGPNAPTTTLNFADKIKVPVFLIAGSGEKPQLSFSVDLEPALVNAPSVTRVEVEGADHFYKGRHTAVADAIATWLGQFRYAK